MWMLLYYIRKELVVLFQLLRSLKHKPLSHSFDPLEVIFIWFHCVASKTCSDWIWTVTLLIVTAIIISSINTLGRTVAVEASISISLLKLFKWDAVFSKLFLCMHLMIDPSSADLAVACTSTTIGNSLILLAGFAEADCFHRGCMLADWFHCANSWSCRCITVPSALEGSACIA